MKSVLFTISLSLLCIFSSAQEETLFDNARIVGGFGAPIFEYSTVNGEFGTLFGGGGGVVINDFFFGGFGLGGSFAQNRVAGELYDIDMGYGGLWIGYTYPSHRLVHLYSDLKIGWGGASYRDANDDFFDFDFDNRDIDAFFALEPGLGLELNVFRWFRVAATGGYRYVTNINALPGLDNKDFRSWTGTLTLRFGGFGRRYYEDR